MRKYHSVILLFLLAISAGACKKTIENFTAPEDLQVGAYISIDSTINTKLSPNSPAGIMVHGVGQPLTKIIYYVSLNGSADKAQWKKIGEVPVTDNKATITFSNSQLATALGSTPDPGTSFTIYSELYTVSGQTYSLANTATSFESESAYKMALRFSVVVVCPFTGGMAGDYKIIRDDWQDYSVGDIITNAVADGPGANQISLHVFPNPAYGDAVNPIIVNVDPASGTATVPAVQYGDYGVLISAVGDGFVFSCAGFITLNLRHFSAGSNYGTYKLVLQKQ